MSSKQVRVLATTLLSLFAIVAFGCRTAPESVASQATIPTVLNVALFPYIPDASNDRFVGLLTHLKREFETRNPGIELRLRSLDPIKDDFYDVDRVSKWLTDKDQTNKYDLVEVDTVILGDLLTMGAIRPWPEPFPRKDYPSVALRAVTLNETPYAVPHLLCGHYLFTHSSRVAKSSNLKQLAQNLKAEANGVPCLVGNFAGSWNMPALYFDAWSDTHGAAPASALVPNLDGETMRYFKEAVLLGKINGRNPCLDGSYGDEHPVKAAEMFARREAGALLGYSERLHYVLRAGDRLENIHIRSATLGNGDLPLMFVDALVLRVGAPDAVVRAAQAFATFLNSPAINEYLLLSYDSPVPRIPRYLIPAARSAFHIPAIRNNRVYQELARDVQRAKPFPNTGFPVLRKSIRDQLTAEISKP